MPAERARSHVKASIVPFAVVAVVVLAAQLGFEFSLPADGPARQDELESGPVWQVRLVSAGVLSVATLLLVRGVVADRTLLRGRDDRIAGEYLATALLAMIVCTFCGAFPGLVIAAGVAGAVPWARRRSADVHGAPARDARNIAFAVMTANLLLIGARETYATYVKWDEGYGVSGARIAAFRDDHGGTVVVTIALVVAVLASLLLPLALWRHRRGLSGAGAVADQTGVRTLFAFASVAVGILGFIAANWIGAVVGVVCLVATFVLAAVNRGEPAGLG